MPFWKKALWAGVFISAMEECQKKEAKSEEIGYNQRPAIQSEYRGGISDYGK